MNFWKRWIGDYAKKTAHLSLAQHGAYTLLLDHYYATEHSLPAGHDELFRICRAFGKHEQSAVVAVADAFFPVGDDGRRHNERADEEIPKAKEKTTANQANGKLGGRPRKTDSLTEPEPTKNLSHSHKEQDQELPASLRSASSSASDDAAPPAESKPFKAGRLAEVTDSAVSEFNDSPLVKPNGGNLAAVSPTIGREKRQAQVRRCLRTASAICAERYGGTLVTPEFWRDYFAECAADDFSSGRTGGGRDHPNWVPDFEYLTREATMLKIYDRATVEGGA